MFDLAVNYTALVVAAVAVFGLGFVWFGPIFGKAWMKEQTFSKAELENGKSGMWKSYLLMYVSTLVTGYVLAHILQFTDAANTQEALVTAFWVWLGFYAAGSLHYYLFPQKSFKLYLLDNVYQLVSLSLIAVILTSWI